MAIGEFGGAPAVPGDSSALLSAAPMLLVHEMKPRGAQSARAWADATRLFYKNPVNPLSFTPSAKRSPRRPNCSSARDAGLLRPSRNGASPRPWSAASACPVQVLDGVGNGRSAKLVHFERVFQHQPRRPQRGS